MTLDDLLTLHAEYWRELAAQHHAHQQDALSNAAADIAEKMEAAQQAFTTYSDLSTKMEAPPE